MWNFFFISKSNVKSRYVDYFQLWPAGRLWLREDDRAVVRGREEERGRRKSQSVWWGSRGQEHGGAWKQGRIHAAGQLGNYLNLVPNDTLENYDLLALCFHSKWVNEKWLKFFWK